jgi:uncharacterized membrane protein YcaP (DUF421 family)
MGQEVLFAAIRTIFAYMLVLVAVRIIGRKSISQMTFSDFAVGVTLGSVTANLALGSKHTAYSATAIIAVFTLLAVLTAYIRVKSLKGRKIVNSEPVIVIDNGRIVNRNMERIRITLNELSALLREKNVFSMGDVEFAIMESDGQLSVLPKAQKMPLTPEDMNIHATYKGLTKDLILDGNIMAENLISANKDEKWLLKELSKQSINDVRNVFYAGLDSSGGLYVSVRKESKEEHGQYGID